MADPFRREPTVIAHPVDGLGGDPQNVGGLVDREEFGKLVGQFVGELVERLVDDRPRLPEDRLYIFRSHYYKTVVTTAQSVNTLSGGNLRIPTDRGLHWCK
jgi:hypothetical protein